MRSLSSRLSLAAIALVAAVGCSDSTAPAGSTDVLSLSVLPPNAIPVSKCQTFITAPGDYWLTKELVNCQGPFAAIRINASGAILHLNGHRVATIPGSEPDIAIELIGDNATVVGPGFVSSGNFAIFINGSNNHVRYLTVKPYDMGIYVAGGTNNVIRGVTFREGGYAAVDAASGATGTVIRRNTVRDPLPSSGDYGFLIFSSDGLIDSNRVEAMGSGIEIRGTQNTVSNNRVAWSGAGILVEGTGNFITGNLLRDHNGSDMIDRNVDACVVNTWTNNLFLTAYPDCLQ